MPTGTELPLELHWNIIQFVGANKSGSDSDWYPHWRPSKLALLVCSTVCIDWAQQCRNILYSGRRISINSLKRAQGFRQIALTGSEHLPPIIELIAGVDIEQDFESSSWIHHLYLPSILERVSSWKLELKGPYLQDLPSLLQSPHWSVPTLMPPSVIPFGSVHLSDLACPSFKHFTKLLRRLAYLEDLDIWGVTWQDNWLALAVPNLLMPRRSSNANVPVKRRPLRTVSAWFCTNNAHACLQAAKCDPSFPLSRLLPEGTAIAWSLIEDMYANGLELDHDNSLTRKCTLSRGSNAHDFSFRLCHEHGSVSLRFTCLPLSPSVQALVQPHKVVLATFGFMLIVPEWASDSTSFRIFMSAVFDHRIWAKSLQFSTLQVFVLAVKDMRLLGSIVEAYRNDLRDMHKVSISRLACKRANAKGDTEVWVGMDPLSMRATGETWVHEDDIVPALLQKTLH